MMASRGVLLSHETVRRWCDKFGQQYAAGLRGRRSRTGDKWHLDEVFLKINGVTHYLWGAVDQNGVVLDILVHPKRNRLPRSASFTGFCEQLAANHASSSLTNSGVYGAAKRVVMPSVPHRQHRYPNNRAENSRQPTRERGECDGSNPPDTPSALSRFTESLLRISVRVATCSPPPT